MTSLKKPFQLYQVSLPDPHNYFPHLFSVLLTSRKVTATHSLCNCIPPSCLQSETDAQRN